MKKKTQNQKFIIKRKCNACHKKVHHSLFTITQTICDKCNHKRIALVKKSKGYDALVFKKKCICCNKTKPAINFKYIKPVKKLRKANFTNECNTCASFRCNNSGNKKTRKKNNMIQAEAYDKRWSGDLTYGYTAMKKNARAEGIPCMSKSELENKINNKPFDQYDGKDLDLKKMAYCQDKEKPELGYIPSNCYNANFETNMHRSKLGKTPKQFLGVGGTHKLKRWRRKKKNKY